MLLSQAKDLTFAFGNWIVSSRGILFRGALSLVLGAFILVLDSSTHFDRRFNVRGKQPTNNEIVIILIDTNNWGIHSQSSRNQLQEFKEYTGLGDSFFWNQDLWHNLLSEILKSDPKAIGVDFIFSSGLQSQSLPPIFHDSKIIWASNLNQSGQMIPPLTSKDYGSNTGINSVEEDEDRKSRRFSPPISDGRHFSIRLAQIATKDKSIGKDIIPGESYIINYRGKPGTYPTYSLNEIQNLKFSQKFKNKIVIIGAQNANSHRVNTPLGFMNRSEYMATLVDNLVDDRWIRKPHIIWSVAWLFVILILSIWVLFSYPQTVALVFLFWIGTGIGALSLWIFDSFYFWIPVLSPLSMIGFVYIIFLGYQLSQKENLSWKLSQEKKTLYEIEQLKHNFVSLISHDLKTPIAKIQGICDRLLSKSLDSETNEDIQSLRRESVELHRYIQSILKVSRIESKDFRINKEAHDINETIESVVTQLAPLAENKKIQIDSNLEPMFTVEFDIMLIHEVILNLIENAIKYTPEGGQITVRSQEINDQIIFWVKDSGPGIDENEKTKIFEKFYRGDDQKMKTKGSGIGLYLVKYFIELHRGKVFLESSPEKGTKIGFHLPILDDTQPTSIMV